jgi:hypothetical protein
VAGNLAIILKQARAKPEHIFDIAKLHIKEAQALPFLAWV